MAEPEKLLLDEPGPESLEPEEVNFDDAPEFELEEESEVTDSSSYTDDILNAEPIEPEFSLVESDEAFSEELPSEEIGLADTQDSPTEASPADSESDVEESSSENSEDTVKKAGPLSEEETESIELLLSEADEDSVHETTEPASSKEAVDAEAESIEKIDTQVVELQHSLNSLHQQQAHQLEMSLLERVDDLIQVLERKHKPGHSPEQLPHKQFATALHYISNEKNHYLGGKWLRKAAMQGHGKAQLYLGMLFVQGNGVPKSLFHAYAWFSLAVCQNIDEAKDARKKLEPHLTAKEINSSLRYAADLLDKIQQL